MFLLKIIRRAARMCPPARRIQKLSLLIACVLLFAALWLLSGVDGFSVHTYRTFHIVYALLETGSAVLLVGVLGAVLIEDRYR